MSGRARRWYQDEDRGPVVFWDEIIELDPPEDPPPRTVDLSCLTEKQRWVIERRYGLNGFESCTQWELAVVSGIERANIAQIEARALKKLRKAIP